MTAVPPTITLDNFDRNKSRTVLMGDKNFNNVPLSWNGQPLVDMHSDRSLFSHQRAFVRSALELEERSLVAVLGFQDRRHSEGDACGNYTVLPKFSLLRSANNHFYDSLDDQSRRGVTRLYLCDESHIVLVASVTNSFGNNVQLLAEPMNTRQNAFLRDIARRDDVVNSAVIETMERLQKPIYLDLNAAFGDNSAGKKIVDEQRIDDTWKIVRFHVRSAFMDGCEQPVCRRVVDVLPTEDACSDDSCACCRNVEDGGDEELAEEMVLAFGDTICRHSKCWCIRARSNGDYQRGLNDSEPIDRLQRLVDRCLPRSYAQTFVRHWHNTGTFVAAFSLCMFNDTRNNWFVVPSLAIDRFVDLAESFSNCNYHVVRNMADLKDFFAHYDYYSRTKNVIIIEDYLCFCERPSSIGPLRMILYLLKPCPLNHLTGRYNYIIYDYDLHHWSLYKSQQSYTTLSFVYSGVERMFDLPDIDQIVHLANRYCSSEIYDPNLRLSSASENEALLYTMFTDAYVRFDALPRAHDPVRWHAFKDHIDHMYEKVRKDNCVVCMSRTADYYVPTCCFNPICIVCCARLDKLSCPMCRKKFSDACLVPFILPDDEYTSTSTPSAVDASDLPCSSQSLASPPSLKRRFEKYCNPFTVMRRDLESLVDDVGFIVCSDGRYAFKVLIVDTDGELNNEQLKIDGFYTYFMENYSRATAQYFKHCRMHAILVIRSFSCLRCNPMPFVTHVYFMRKPTLIEYRYVIYSTHRYPRRVNLLINQFVQYPEFMHPFTLSSSPSFTF